MSTQYDLEAEAAFPLLGELGAALREFDALTDSAQPPVSAADRVKATAVTVRLLSAESGSLFDPAVFRRLMAAAFIAGARSDLRDTITADAVKAMEAA